MKVIKVKASKNYEIIVDRGFDSFKANILPKIKGDKVAVITDTNVAPLYYSKIESLLEG